MTDIGYAKSVTPKHSKEMLMRCIIMVLFLAVLPLALCVPFCRAAETDLIKKPVAESIRIRQDTQSREQQWRDDRVELLASYDRLEEMKKQLEEQRVSLGERVKNTKERLAVKQKQLDDVEAIRTEIGPMITILIEELVEFVAGDLQFLAEERRNRLQRLVELRDDPEVAVSEKFRKVLEALLVEAEYGNTIEVYQETIDEGGGRDILVDIFRLGRVGLFFQTLDRKSCGFYNMADATWQSLPSSSNRTIEIAMEIGARRRPAELVTLPLGRIHLQ